MSKTNKLLLVGLIIAVLFLGISALKESKQSSKVKPANKVNQPEDNLNTQENEGGNVTVNVKPKTLKVGKNSAFELEFETHSVDLDFDVAKQSYIVDNKGKRFNNGIWNGSPPGGHHRSGTLSFNNSLTQTNYVELIIKNIAGISERKFRWEL